MSILLVDADPLSLRVLDFSLRGAGFAVTVASDAAGALATLDAGVPDLVVVDTRLHGSDGFTLVRAIRERAGRADLPAIFLATEDRAEDRARAAELGVEDTLVKPVFVRELLARIQLLLASRIQQVVAADVSLVEGEPLTGTTHEIALVDLLQSLESTRTTGVVHVLHEGREARIYLRDGDIVDAELERSRGSDVIVRTLTWHPASFRVEPGPVDNDDLLECSTDALLMRVIDRLDGRTPAPPLTETEVETPPPPASDAGGVPSTMPWTRDAGASFAQTGEADLLAEGVPRASTGKLRRIGIIASALGAMGLIAVGFASMRARRSQRRPPRPRSCPHRPRRRPRTGPSRRHGPRTQPTRRLRRVQTPSGSWRRARARNLQPPPLTLARPRSMSGPNCTPNHCSFARPTARCSKATRPARSRWPSRPPPQTQATPTRGSPWRPRARRRGTSPGPGMPTASAWPTRGRSES
jgi:DNA-binding response OmpR family regulator